eukprot:2420297-Prymnesium_polylepis.1
MQRDRRARDKSRQLCAFVDGVAAWLRDGRHHARGHPAEERLALVVAVSDDERSIGPPADAPSH